MCNDVIYKKILGCAAASPSAPIIANMVMEEIEPTALNIYLKPPLLWVRYVDDVCAIMKKTEVESYHNYVNTLSTLISS